MRLCLLTLMALVFHQDPPKKLWSMDTVSASYGSAQAADIDGDGKLEIVFGTYYNDEHLYAVNAEDGSLCWKFKSAGGPFDASVAIADLDGDKKLEIVTGDSGDGTFFCIDGAGKELWKMKLPSGTDSPPAVADLDADGTPEIVVGTMMAQGKQGRLCCIDPKKREFKWQAKVAGHVQSEPCLVDLNGDKVLDAVITTWMGDARIHAYNGKDGVELWAYEMDESKQKFPANSTYHGVTAVEFEKGELSLVATTCGGGIYAVDAKGALRWKLHVKDEYFFAPTCAGDLDGDGTPELIVAGHHLHVLDGKGKEKWMRKGKEGNIDRGAALVHLNDDQKLDLLVAFGTAMVAIDGGTGKDLWSFEARFGKNMYESIGSGPIVADFDGDGGLDLFFVCGKGTSDETKKENYGRAYALKVGGKGDGWTTFRGDLRRTGWRK